MNPLLKQTKDKFPTFAILQDFIEWMGKIDEAMELLDKTETLSPDYWEIPFNRASFQLRLNEFDNSLANALKATQIAQWKP